MSIFEKIENRKGMPKLRARCGRSQPRTAPNPLTWSALQVVHCATVRTLGSTGCRAMKARAAIKALIEF